MPAAFKRVANVLGVAPYTGEIIRNHAFNRWDPDDEFDEWAPPMAALPPDAERIVGVGNRQLAGCRLSDAALEKFVVVVHGLS
jgi:hypothetical protein